MNELRDKFEQHIMDEICISKETLICLRDENGYRNSTLSGIDYNRLWRFFLAGFGANK